MKKVELEVINVTQGFTHHHSYAVVLGEINGKRRLPIVIGVSEAQAIALAIENMSSARPLTHDLLKTVMETFHIQLSEVIITDLLEGIYYSKLICIFDGEEYEIDSRTSDAVALCVRFGCPLYIDENILNNSGIILMEEQENKEENTDNVERKSTKIDIKDEAKDAQSSPYTLNEIQNMMREAIANEDYEKAAFLRDELKKLQNK
ncbi:MAG: bifunctional nuclease family protein [Chitinophagales bacterium]|nr:bifunctional nuclease family protein [Bacteroidota bacterium]